MSDNFEIMEKELLSDNKCGYDKIDDKEKEKIFAFSEGYKEFLNACKTERECTLWAEERVKKFGYKEFGEFETLKPGDKFYIKNTDKSIFLWDRRLDEAYDSQEYRLIHGHTPTVNEGNKTKAKVHRHHNVINVDCGSNFPKLGGRMAALCIETDKVLYV